MDSSLPVLIAGILVVVLVSALLYALWSAFRVSYLKLEYGKEDLTIMKRWKWSAPILIWLVGVSILGFIHDSLGLSEAWLLLVVIAIPLIVFLIFYRWKRFRSLVDRIPLNWLILWQVNRLFLELLYWMGVQTGELPFQISFIGLNYDVITGITAPLLAYGVARKQTGWRLQSRIWNLFGLLLLLNFYVLVFLSLPSGEQIFTNFPDASLIMEFPFIWIPALLGPISIVAHILALLRAEQE